MSPNEILASFYRSGGEQTHLLSQQAYKSTSLEGTWDLDVIEGELPSDLVGQLLRVGPGFKSNHEHRLNHFFDGDAYYNKFQFDGRQVQLQAGFIDTPERKEELRRKKMVYDDFGTEAPRRTRKRKNNPNINLIKWRDGFLALSEGGHPSLLDQETLKFQEHHNFLETLPKNTGFTAHPKYDPSTGKSYGFGIKQNASQALVVFEMDPLTGKLDELASIDQSHVFMVHDMMITENYLLFFMGSVYFKLMNIVLDRGSLADALTYDSSLRSQLIVIPKKRLGPGAVKRIKLPPCTVFHHGNAYEEGDRLIFDSFITRDGSLLELIKNWHDRPNTSIDTPTLTRFEVDMKKEYMISAKSVLDNHDFPVFNKAYTGKKSRYLYSVGMGTQEDLMAFASLTKFDAETKQSIHYQVGPGEAIGESIFEARVGATAEDDGYLLAPIYRSDSDKSALDIVDAKTMRRLCRLDMKNYFPLGFHGNFYRH